MLEMEEPCSDSCPHTPLPLFKASLATGIPPRQPPILFKGKDPKAQLRMRMAKLLLILGILNSPLTWIMFMKDDLPFDPTSAELAPSDILFSPHSKPFTGHVCTSLAWLAWSKETGLTWQFRLDSTRPTIVGCSHTGSTRVLDTLVS